MPAEPGSRPGPGRSSSRSSPGWPASSSPRASSPPTAPSCAPVGRDLPGLITDQNRDVATKAEQVKQLQAEVDRLSAAAAPGDATAKALRAQAAALAPLVGTQPVSGPAVTVSLDDAHRSAASLPKPYGPDDIVVHQQDVQGVVNALWAGGAEAMMIQDQRVISTSAVQCVGNTLLLQGRVYSPPYVITAIGDPNRLRAALDRDPSVQIYREWVDAVGPRLGRAPGRRRWSSRASPAPSPCEAVTGG